MSTLDVIGTFYRRWENTEPLMLRVMLDSTRPPDTFWLMCEDDDDGYVALEARDFQGLRPTVVILPTPRDGSEYAVIPYSHKINWALDRSTADYIVYLDNGSMPHPEKYERMAAALDEHPEWGAVYCGQNRTGLIAQEVRADRIVTDAYCYLNFTQVMHRRTPDRWTLDMQYARPDLADALFWRSLHASLGAFHPVAPDLILDEHHIPDIAAVGV